MELPQVSYGDISAIGDYRQALVDLVDWAAHIGGWDAACGPHDD
jgi:hypothetical protein